MGRGVVERRPADREATLAALWSAWSGPSLDPERHGQDRGEALGGAGDLTRASFGDVAS